MLSTESEISIIIPAFNEEEGLKRLLPVLRDLYPGTEILVVNDCSSDGTGGICDQTGVRQIRHPVTKGNGASIKTGARHAKGRVFVFMDADGQHLPEDIERLLQKIEEGYDMAVGARDSSGQASIGRMVANRLYNGLATLITGHVIADLTSGFRAVRAELFKRCLYLLPNGFSYPTTVTMAFFRAGYSTAYVPIKAKQRQGKSHLRPLKDGVRFLLIIFRIGTLYSPLKIFAPVSFLFFLTGICYYAYTYITMSRFTNMSALLFIIAILIFLIGLISEQITALLYQNQDE